jgi:hypothetical protein
MNPEYGLVESDREVAQKGFRRPSRRADIPCVSRTSRSWICFALAVRVLPAACISACAHGGSLPGSDGPAVTLPGRASLLPDLSGLAGIDGDRFLAVHDAKYPDEEGFPRVSVLEVPNGLDGIRWTTLDIAFPDQPASDLESVARIPGGTDRFLVAESTEDASEKPFSNRIFVLEMTGDGTAVVDHAVWPVPTTNVEGIAVAEAGDGKLLFLFAERADGERATEIRFAELSLVPLGFGPFRSAGSFASPGPMGPTARPVAALEVDPLGSVYAASTEDPDEDGGPFRSAVYRIGRIVRGAVELDAAPTLIGTLDGLKVESLAARQRPDQTVEIWVGVDDEYYGGTMRPLPAPPGFSGSRTSTTQSSSSLSEPTSIAIASLPMAANPCRR